MQKSCVVHVDRILPRQPLLESTGVEPLKVLMLTDQL